MTDKDFLSFKEIARLSQPDLRRLLATILKKKYPKGQVFCDKKYLVAEGNIPIALVAHLDTVHRERPQFIFRDKEEDIVWSPQGLGADDRAGVFMILEILASGFLPHVIFTTDEEKGGIGASALADHKNPFKDLRYMIELDRSGYIDCVFYECNNKEFEKYVESFGFKTDWGTYSDICELCPAWGVAGVNLSVGYFYEHTLGELLNTSVMYETIAKVKLMLMEMDIPSFKFIPYENTAWHYNGSIVKCEGCKSYLTEVEAIPVLRGSEEIVWYCPDCLVDKVHWCINCGEPFEIEKGSKEKLCDICKEHLL